MITFIRLFEVKSAPCFVWSTFVFSPAGRPSFRKRLGTNPEVRLSGIDHKVRKHNWFRADIFNAHFRIFHLDNVLKRADGDMA